MYKVEGFDPISYNALCDLISMTKETPLSARKHLDFYNKHPEYKTLGNYIIYATQHNGKINGVSIFNEIMIKDKVLESMMEDLSKCALLVKMKPQLGKIIENHQDLQADIKLLAICDLQEEVKELKDKKDEQQVQIKDLKILLENNNTKHQEEMSFLKNQMGKMLDFLKTLPGAESLMDHINVIDHDNDNFAQMAGENTAAENPNII